MSGRTHVAVADYWNHRVSVFSVDGEFVRHVGADVLKWPRGVACSAFDELVVAGFGNILAVVFSSSGDVVMRFGCGDIRIAVVHGDTVIAHDCDSQRYVIFT
jgi:hypothetical protein